MANLDQVFYDYINRAINNMRISPLNLGASYGANGGIGGPPGGFVGYLPQTRIAYDTTESGTLATSGTPSLLDNLNHIRYDIDILNNVFTVSGTALKIGNVSSGNYLTIDTNNGTLRLVGHATSWDDVRITGASTRLGSTAPTLALFGPSGNIRTLQFESGHDDEVHFEIQMPHAWKEGSKIYPHIHWAPINTTAGNVVWTLDYTWADINGTFSAPSTMNTDATAAGGTAWVHKITAFKDGSGNAYIDGTGKTLSSMIVCRLHRNAGSGSDTLSANVAFLEFDIHYEIDSFGSDEEYIKNAS